MTRVPQSATAHPRIAVSRAAVASMALTKRRRRLGDRLCGSVVVEAGRETEAAS